MPTSITNELDTIDFESDRDAAAEKRIAENLGFPETPQLSAEKETWIIETNSNEIFRGFDYCTHLPEKDRKVIVKFAKESAAGIIDRYKERMQEAKEAEDPLDVLADQFRAFATLYQYAVPGAARQFERANHTIYTHIENSNEPMPVLKQNIEDPVMGEYVDEDVIDTVIQQLGLEEDHEEVDETTGDAIMYYKPIGANFVFMRHTHVIEKGKDEWESGKYTVGLGVKLGK